MLNVAQLESMTIIDSYFLLIKLQSSRLVTIASIEYKQESQVLLNRIDYFAKQYNKLHQLNLIMDHTKSKINWLLNLDT